MKKVLKAFGWILAALFVVGTFILLWKQSQPKKAQYSLETPAVRDIVKCTSASGVLESRTKVELKPQITGIVSKLCVNAGDFVRSGDLVAIIKVIPEMAQLTQAQSQVESCRIELEQVERDAARCAALFEKGVVSREENEHKQNLLKSAEDKLDAALAQVEVITKGSSSRAGSVNTTEVRSTMNGLILSVPVKVGTSVSGSSAFSQGTTIATVADMKDVIFKGNIDETDVAKLHTGMEVSLVPGAMQDITIPGILDYIAPEGVLQNGAKTFELKATAHVPEGIEIRSGYSVNARFVIDKAESVISIPEACVIFQENGTYVDKLTGDSDKKQEFERIPVTVGISDGLYVEIRDGITTDMKVKGSEKTDL